MSEINYPFMAFSLLIAFTATGIAIVLGAKSWDAFMYCSLVYLIVSHNMEGKV
jgi:hypothetical protein